MSYPDNGNDSVIHYLPVSCGLRTSNRSFPEKKDMPHFFEISKQFLIKMRRIEDWRGLQPEKVRHIARPQPAFHRW
ncbi:hypothetical protein [Citrobacter freundii]